MHTENELGETAVEHTVEHLEDALDASANERKNYHIRQALQLLIADEC